jgi:hypothetical protein
MEPRLLEILVCPLCKGPLQYHRTEQELVCTADKLAFPINDGVPVMLENEARDLALDQDEPPAPTAATSTAPQADEGTGTATD